MADFAAADLAVWLSKLGLEQYAPAFRENHIDSAVLPELTAEDLIGARHHVDRAPPQAARRDRGFEKGRRAFGDAAQRGADRERLDRGRFR